MSGSVLIDHCFDVLRELAGPIFASDAILVRGCLRLDSILLAHYQCLVCNAFENVRKKYGSVRLTFRFGGNLADAHEVSGMWVDVTKGNVHEEGGEMVELLLVLQQGE